VGASLPRALGGDKVRPRMAGLYRSACATSRKDCVSRPTVV
jgi:hypothetical protein